MSGGEQGLGPPRGMRDFYPEDMAVRNAIFDAWRDASRQFGFAHYDACVVESLEVLKRKAGEEITDQIYTFLDKSGRELALRPEMTPTLARMVAAQQSSLCFPLKWFAIAQCFRYERMTRGRKREHYQWNLDILGEPAVSAEAEVIACAVDALGRLGIQPGEVLVHFSSRALLADLLQAHGIAADHHAAAFLALDKRGKISDDDIRAQLATSGVDDAGIAKIFTLLAVSGFDEAAASLPPDCASVAAVRQFLSIVDAYGLRDRVRFDISVIRGLSYYTGIVFEAFDVNRQFRAIFGGGRYDNLLRDIGGTPMTGVGLGFGDVVIAELLAELHRLPGQGSGSSLAVGYMEDGQRTLATTVARAFRNQGRWVDLALRAEKAKHFFSRVGRGQFSEAVYLGPDDVLKGTIRVKTLATRAETELPLASLA